MYSLLPLVLPLVNTTTTCSGVFTGTPDKLTPSRSALPVLNSIARAPPDVPRVASAATQIIVRASGVARWQTLERLLDLAAAHGGNVRQVSPSFFFRTISAERIE